MKPRVPIASFDSATGMLRALSRYLHGAAAGPKPCRRIAPEGSAPRPSPAGSSITTRDGGPTSSSWGHRPGGTLVVVDCGLRWPVTRVGERYVFQHGAPGGATIAEYEEGGPRIAAYLSRYGSPHRAWDYPPTDERAPEAEWGFEPDLFDDLAALARDEGWRLARLRFADPEDLSPVVSDLYKSWYAARGLPGDRLLVECFLLLEPWWALRSGSAPYWMVFNTDPSRDRLGSYLDRADPYDEIRLLLFSHGVDSVGLVPIQSSEQLLSRARKIGVVTGVDRDAYTRDFASLARAHRELAQVRTRYPMPLPLDPNTPEEFLAERDELDWDTD